MRLSTLALGSKSLLIAEIIKIFRLNASPDGCGSNVLHKLFIWGLIKDAFADNRC